MPVSKVTPAGCWLAVAVVVTLTSLVHCYGRLDADTVEYDSDEGGDINLAKRWAPSDIDVFKRDSDSGNVESSKKWAPSELSLYKRDPWASSEIRVGHLIDKMRTRVQRNRQNFINKREDFDDSLFTALKDAYHSTSGIPPTLLKKIAYLQRAHSTSGHVTKRAAHPVHVGMGGNAAARALGIFAQVMDHQRGMEHPGTKVRFIGK